MKLAQLDGPMNTLAASKDPEVRWDEWFAQLSTYKTTAGTLHIPVGVAEPLRIWCGMQREAKRESRLRPQRQERLDSIGFEWTPVESAWARNYQALVDFKAAHGKIDVAYIKCHDKELSIWANRQKGRLSRGEATSDQATKLLGLGLVPAVSTVRRTVAEVRQAREDTLAELAAYRKEHGHVQITPDEDPTSLFLRVRKLRHISVARDEPLRRRLVSLSAFQTFPDFQWESKFSAWKAYSRSTGDYRCEKAPKPLKAWYIAVERCLLLERDPLAVPLWRRYLGVGTAEFKNVLRAAPRLHAAGFNRNGGPITESSVRCVKLGTICGLHGELPPLRSLLKVLTLRYRAGRLVSAAEAEIRRLGFTWDSERRCWRGSVNGARMSGAVLTAHPVAASSRDTAIATARLRRTKSLGGLSPEMRKQMRASARESARIRNIASARAAISPTVSISNSGPIAALEAELVLHMSGGATK